MNTLGILRATSAMLKINDLPRHRDHAIGETGPLQEIPSRIFATSSCCIARVRIRPDSAEGGRSMAVGPKTKRLPDRPTPELVARFLESLRRDAFVMEAYNYEEPAIAAPEDFKEAFR